MVIICYCAGSCCGTYIVQKKNEEKKRLGRDHEIMENQKKKIRETRM